MRLELLWEHCEWMAAHAIRHVSSGVLVANGFAELVPFLLLHDPKTSLAHYMDCARIHVHAIAADLLEAEIFRDNVQLSDVRLKQPVFASMGEMDATGRLRAKRRIRK